METAPRLETIAPTKSRSHHHRHSALIHHLLGEGKYLPTLLAQDDEENKLVVALQDSILALSQRIRLLVCWNTQNSSSCLFCSQRAIFSYSGSLSSTSHIGLPAYNLLLVSYGFESQGEVMMTLQPSLQCSSTPVKESCECEQQGCSYPSFECLAHSICRYSSVQGHCLCRYLPSSPYLLIMINQK